MMRVASGLVLAFFLGTSKAHSALERADLALAQKIDSAISELDELEEERKSLSAQLRSPALASSRHGANDVTLFSAYASSTQCGTGTITAWVEYLDVAANVDANNFVNGIWTVPQVDGRTNYYYYFNACFLCAQGSACDVRMLHNGSPVAAIGNRDNTGSQRFNQMCNGKLLFMANGDTVLTQETAGGGNPNNCKRSGAWRHNTFNGFMIRRVA